MKTAPDFAKPILFLLGMTLTSLAFAQDSTQKALEQARVVLRRAVQEGRVAGTAHLVLRDGKTIFSEAAGLSDIGDRTPFKFVALDPAASSPFNDGSELLSGGGRLVPSLPNLAGSQFAAVCEGLNLEANAVTPSLPP